MNLKQLVEDALKTLNQVGLEEAEINLSLEQENEMNAENGMLSLYRTINNLSVTFTGIIQKKKASITINEITPEKIQENAEKILEMAKSSEPDEANKIAPDQGTHTFRSGIFEPDNEKLLARMDEFNHVVKQRYPKTNLRSTNVSYFKEQRIYHNSNGTYFEQLTGGYAASTTFSSKDGETVSSFNYTYTLMNDLDTPIQDLATFDTLLQQSANQIYTKQLPETFVGDVIVTPDCIDSVFVYPFSSMIGTFQLMKGTSIYKDKMNEKIASEKLTVKALPIHDEFVFNNNFSSDGFLRENQYYIENGVLKAFNLGYYGALKTGLEKPKTTLTSVEIENGDTAFEEMIKKTKKGVLLCRFSGGNPNQDGDFSGIAKNSFLIEDGKITIPLSEVMVTGNIAEMIQNIDLVSKEQVNFGICKYPWIRFNNLTISGK